MSSKGDFVADDNGWVMILKQEESHCRDFLPVICIISPDNLLYGVESETVGCFTRSATSEEIKRLHRVLCKNGYQYDAKNFKIIKSEF